jgi:hypothetical protein
MNLAADFLKPRLTQSHTTIVVPLDKRVIFVRSHNRSESSCRLSKVAQAYNTITGIQFRIGSGGRASGGFLARSASAGAPACDKGGSGALLSFDVRLLLIFHHPSGLLRLFICSLTGA